MARANIYRGFSSFEFERTKQFKLTDLELVKMDLLNHIFTRRGERVMMPTFGSSIPDMLFEPLDADLLAQLEDELIDIIDHDPRVQLERIRTVPLFDQNTVQVPIDLRYIELNMVDTLELNLQFEGNT